MSHRQITDDEKRAALHGISIFSPGRRREARAEMQRGEVEELEFRVSRAWNLITCLGPPCCPNTWLVQAESGEFIHLESWTLLRAVEECFPGSHLRVARLPSTHRLVSAHASGEPVRADRLDEEDEHLVDDFPECELIPLGELPPSCRR